MAVQRNLPGRAVNSCVPDDQRIAANAGVGCRLIATWRRATSDKRLLAVTITIRSLTVSLQYIQLSAETA